jgi:diguanylate cyclase (GGDEF)-like protein/PAS domain S-box-containing protein
MVEFATDALPLAVSAFGAVVLALGLAGESTVLRIALVAMVLAGPLVQADRLRARNRLIAIERDAMDRRVETEERLRMLLERVPAAVYLDRYRRSDGAFVETVYMSPQMHELTGYSAAELDADPEWMTLIHPDDRERVLGTDVPGLSGNSIELEYRMVRRDGRVIWIREEARLLDSPNAETVLSHGFLLDITDRKELEQQLGRLAFEDALTGLANRAQFIDRLALAVARSAGSGQYPAVLFLDLDEFKAVNDSLGHGAGDRLLQVVAERLLASVRPADCVARLGGDEFAILLEAVGDSGIAIAAAGRILAVLETPIEVEGRRILGRASIGIAIAAEDTGSAHDLLRDADTAMYQAKAAGRGQWVLFEPRMHEAALARLDGDATSLTAVADARESA